MKWLRVGSATSFHRDEVSNRSRSIESTSGATAPERYWPGSQVHANDRLRRNATWLFVTRTSVSPIDRMAACTASKSARASGSPPSKYCSREIGFASAAVMCATVVPSAGSCPGGVVWAAADRGDPAHPAHQARGVGCAFTS